MGAGSTGSNSSTTQPLSGPASYSQQFNLSVGSSQGTHNVVGSSTQPFVSASHSHQLNLNPLSSAPSTEGAAEFGQASTSVFVLNVTKLGSPGHTGQAAVQTPIIHAIVDASQTATLLNKIPGTFQQVGWIFFLTTNSNFVLRPPIFLGGHLPAPRMEDII